MFHPQVIPFELTESVTPEADIITGAMFFRRSPHRFSRVKIWVIWRQKKKAEWPRSANRASILNVSNRVLRSLIRKYNLGLHILSLKVTPRSESQSIVPLCRNNKDGSGLYNIVVIC
jgi:hypothetical protein